MKHTITEMQQQTVRGQAYAYPVKSIDFYDNYAVIVCHSKKGHASISKNHKNYMAVGNFGGENNPAFTIDTQYSKETEIKFTGNIKLLLAFLRDNHAISLDMKTNCESYLQVGILQNSQEKRLDAPAFRPL
jgi:hypothetical protein